MQFKVLLSVILATSAVASPSSPTASYPSPVPPRAGYYPPSSERPVYTAQRARELPSSDDDDEPYPSTSSLGTAQTSHGAEEPENNGFVDPIDFKNLLADVGKSSKGLELSASANNPLFASESKNSFSGFFGSNNNKDPFADFGGGLATASSERNHKNHDNSKEDIGFVDPNVQFRSLFDSSQTASNGFKPQDFLENQGGSETERSSQTRTYPSFTYSGRKENDQPRYRSNYRQVETQDDDYSDNYRGRNDDRDYDDSPSHRGGGQSSSPRYNNNQGPRYSPNTEETSHRPQSTGRAGPKAAASESKNNPKCKKVEKTVDYQNEDYAGFIEPEPDYDPSTYRGRYKRQSRQGRQSKSNKRPMTCYVCEDEHGRYAERCSYDSNGNGGPKKGEYFHSSSSSFSDNGRRPSGKSDRHRRNPHVHRQKLEASPTTLSTVLVVAPEKPKASNKKVPLFDENEPKIIEKRQSGPPAPNRYASNFGNNGPRNENSQRRNDFDFQEQSSPRVGAQDEYSLPRGYIGNNNGGRIEEYDSPQFQPQSRNNGDSRRQGSGNRGRNGDGFDFGGGGETSFNDFNFGPPSDFGRESSNSPTESDSGFNFDFSIPKEYDPDVQLTGGNRNRPKLDGSATNNAENSPNDNFDIGYDDYVKRYFPTDGFGPPSSSEASTFRPSPSFQPSAGPPTSHSPPSYRPRSNSFNQYAQNSPPNGYRGVPDKEHTQPSHNFAPPPNFYNDGPQGGFPGGGDDEIENTQNLNKLMENFSGRDRAGCQKVQKGDMSCYVCRDARGMNKEECMYASNDPQNKKMAYHEVSEYSSDPPASILPAPEKLAESQQLSPPVASGSAQAASVISSKTVASPPPTASSSNSKSTSKLDSPPAKSRSVTTRVESTIVTRKVHHENKSPNVEYDFDY